jgi:hypothetical protein
MMKYQFTFFRLIAFCSLMAISIESYSQQDTLHIFYKGLATQVLDSNYSKIGKWAESLKGKRHDVQIFAYYDVSDFKKIMAERVENVQTVVIRKARDFTNIKFAGPVRGKKSQRFVLDIVYSPEGYVAPNAPVVKENKQSVNKSDGNESAKPSSNEPGNVAAKTNNDGFDKKAAKAAKEIAERKAEKAEKDAKALKKFEEKRQRDSKYDYFLDSVYINGVLKVTERKVKKNY